MSFGLEPARANARDLARGRRDLSSTIGARRGTIGLSACGCLARTISLNAMAAAAAALALGIAPAIIEGALAVSQGLPHRLEFVGEQAGVTYIDDSKGTNVASVVEALAAVRAPVMLIAGGMDKVGDYAPLREPLAAKVKLLILIGAARDTMRAALAGATEIELVQTLDEAVTLAARRTRGRHRAALAGLFEFRSVQELCGARANISGAGSGALNA